MAQPISYPSTTANTDLPLLFSGQAQKEFVLNQAFAAIDALICGVVEASLDQPPTAPVDGACYRVGANPAGEWADHADHIAARVGGAWHFVNPREGMEFFDQSAGRRIIFRSQWDEANSPPEAQGGTVVDAEARATLAALIDTLEGVGILGSTI
ncbi:DUF2793 domain-containing protein [Erythrobacter sp.]|uniref:DUF2793 domain-containing protein n=1 Tax=Erythrobacter sp. TaxID=1042 RepID=UPI00342F74A1